MKIYYLFLIAICIAYYPLAIIKIKKEKNKHERTKRALMYLVGGIVAGIGIYIMLKINFIG